jgi:hypothetical protein
VAFAVLLKKRLPKQSLVFLSFLKFIYRSNTFVINGEKISAKRIKESAFIAKIYIISNALHRVFLLKIIENK